MLFALCFKPDTKCIFDKVRLSGSPLSSGACCGLGTSCSLSTSRKEDSIYQWFGASPVRYQWPLFPLAIALFLIHRCQFGLRPFVLFGQCSCPPLFRLPQIEFDRTSALRTVTFALSKKEGQERFPSCSAWLVGVCSRLVV